MQLQFVLRLPTDTKSVPIVRALCRQALTLLGADRQCVTDIALAVTEACANVVLHSSSATSFEVRVDIDDWDCTITVTDQVCTAELRGRFGCRPIPVRFAVFDAADETVVLDRRDEAVGIEGEVVGFELVAGEKVELLLLEGEALGIEHEADPLAAGRLRRVVEREGHRRILCR